MAKTIHIPVLLQEAVLGLNLSSGDNVIDATVGGGGHAKAILEKTYPDGKLLGVDWDKMAIEMASEALKDFGNRAILKQGNYSDIKKIVYESGFSEIRAVLLDLGASCDQFKDLSRGFSFESDESLDMRFSDQVSTTAFDIVNTWPENDLAKIFTEYGEERHAARAAKNIITARRDAPILTAKDLAYTAMRGVGWRGRQRLHPATRVFQALRIAVNSEFENIQKGVPDMVDILDRGGRMAVITFHSLEDRIVKNIFKSMSKADVPIVKLINKKVIKPSREEVLSNRASRSAKLRIIEKL